MTGEGMRESWNPGEVAWFEYHCLESPDSGDAPAWLRSHQRVTVLSLDRGDAWEGSTLIERAQEGVPHTYRVRFADGLEWAAFEDELLSGREHFFRPDPPAVQS